MPEMVKNLYALPYEVFEIRDYDTKYYCILRIAMEKDISAIAALNPSTILLLCQRIEGVKDRVIEDIRQGTLSAELNIRYDVRKKIEASLRPNPRRAEELMRLSQENEGKLLPKDIWPHLVIITCWKGGSVGCYLPHLSRYFGDDIAVRDFGYLSSEARVSIPIRNEGSDGILAITGNFYEFIPHGEEGDGRPLLVHQLREGAEYRIILTTYGGLYRYDIDDIVKVTSFFNNTPVIEFRQKGSIVSSVTGEKVYEAQVSEAVTKAAQKIGVHLQCFSAFVEWIDAPRYAFLVEFADDGLSHQAKKELLKVIEDGLSQLNVEYETKRRSQRLKDPILKVVSCGSFERYRCRQVAEGRHDGQYKIPKLICDATFSRHFDIREEIEL